MYSEKLEPRQQTRLMVCLLVELHGEPIAVVSGVAADEYS